MYTLGYSLPAVEGRQGDRRRAVDPEVHPRDRERARHRRQDPLRPPGRCAPSWSTPDARWTVEVEARARRASRRASPATSCSCAAATTTTTAGYTPEFPGIERFEGRIVHPQKWTDDIDYAGKRVVVIGSGATAVTLVPAMADDGARTSPCCSARRPTWWRGRRRIALANWLRRRLPLEARLRLTRWKNVLLGMYFYQLCQRKPERGEEAAARRRARRCSGRTTTSTRTSRRATIRGTSGCAWCPTRDLFRAIRAGQGLGRHRPDRDLHRDRHQAALRRGARRPTSIVTATGLMLVPLGGVELAVDGARVDPAKTFIYKGMMYQRRAEPRLGVRLHQRLLDAEGRPDLRIRLPPAQSHGPRRLAPVHAAQQRSRPARGALGRLLLRLHPARAGTVCPSRAPSGRGSSTRTTRSTCLSLRFGSVRDNDGVLRAVNADVT